MPRVKLIPVGQDDMNVLSNLMQLYLYDFSQYFCDDEVDGYVDKAGLFPLDFDLRRYTEGTDGRNTYKAFLSQVGGRWAGFAMVSNRINSGLHTGSGHNMDEFFVLRCYRRQGVGRSMAFQVFETWPGFWQVAELKDNVPAQQFWRTIIHAYTGGSYQEVERKNAREEIIVWQTFTVN